MKRVAIVTGSSRGLGKEIVIALSSKFKVGIHYFQGKKNGEEILKRIKDNGGEGELIWGDLSSDEGARNFVMEVKKSLGDPDILINNFGPIIFKDLFEIEKNDWIYMLQTNLLTPYILIREFLPKMIERKWGRIINIGFSESCKPKAFREIVPYSIAKSALLILTLSIAKTLKNSGVTCNIISPYILEEGIPPKKVKKIKKIPYEKITSLVSFFFFGKGF